MTLINRAEELKQLTAAEGHEFVLLSAPRHFGKSYLLHTAESQLPAGWRAAHVNCPDCSRAVAPAVSRDRLLRQLWQAILPGQTYPDGTVPEALGQLMYLVAEIEDALLLVIDGVEQIASGHVARWFRDDVIDCLYEKRREKGLVTRCVVAGLTLAKTWKETQQHRNDRGFFTLTLLPPFQYGHIYATLDERTRRIERESARWSRPPEPMFTNMAREVWRISGGHPLAASRILDKLAEPEVLYWPPTGYFNHDLFETHVSPYYHQAFEPIYQADALPPGAAECFTNLSIFRCYDEQIVETVWTYTVANAPIAQGPVNPFLTLLKCMDDGDLIINDKKTNFYTGHAYRHLLERQLQQAEPDRWLAIHLLALAYYQAARGRYLRNLDRDIAIVTERFYHSSVVHAWRRSAGGVDALRRQLNEDLLFLGQRYCDSAHPDDWSEQIKGVPNQIKTDDAIGEVFIGWGRPGAIDRMADDIIESFL